MSDALVNFLGHNILLPVYILSNHLIMKEFTGLDSHISVSINILCVQKVILICFLKRRRKKKIFLD